MTQDIYHSNNCVRQNFFCRNVVFMFR